MMAELGYVISEDHHGDDDRSVTGVVLVRDAIVTCGPVPLPNFRAHRQRVRRFGSVVSAPPPPHVWYIVIGQADLPEDYVMLWDGLYYVVLDEDGRVVAGPGTDPGVVADEAWEHYNSGPRP